jgi:uncharacterized DUF497 family protein
LTFGEKLVKYQLEMLECLKAEEATALLHRCLESGRTILGRHFREELNKESVSFQDAWGVLTAGAMYDPPEQDVRTGEWKYRVEGYEPDGNWLVIVFSFKEMDTAFLITIWSVESRRRTP